MQELQQLFLETVWSDPAMRRFLGIIGAFGICGAICLGMFVSMLSRETVEIGLTNEFD